MFATAESYRRIAHLAPISLPGGDAAIRNPARVALAHLAAGGIDWADDLAPVRQLTDVERRLLARQIDRNVACVPTTSMGRLFDAVASLLGLRHTVSFEAQAAIDLEAAAMQPDQRDHRYRFGMADGVIDQAPVLAAIVADLRAGVPVEIIAWAFHCAVADVVVTTAAQSNRGTPIVLSGGVFQNALLTDLCVTGLTDAGHVALTHHLVPPNDGGLAVGQAFIAAHRTTSGQRGEFAHAGAAHAQSNQPTSNSQTSSKEQ